MAITNEQLFAFIRKNPIGVGCGVISLAIVGAMYFRSGNLPAVELELEQLTNEGARLSDNVKNSALLKEQLEELTAANAAIDGRLVSARGRFDNQRYFTTLAEASGAAIVSQSQTAEPKNASKGGFVNVPFNVAVQGTYPQVMDFLRRLEYGEHFARVNYSSVSKVPNDTARDNVIVTLNLELLGRP
jgi:hypothetical protein